MNINHHITRGFKHALFFALTAIFAISFTTKSTAQSCGTDSFLDNCAPGLEDYTFIKMFNAESDGSGSKTDVSYVLSKGSTYRIVICDQNIKGSEMTVKLLDRNKKLIATNYLSSSRKYYPVLNYTCNATGVYYIQLSFKKGKEGCGVIILGFTK